MRPDPKMIPVLIGAAKALKGSRVRIFMVKTAPAMGQGGQRWVREHLGWCREAIREGTHELRSGMICPDASHRRRREPADDLEGKHSMVSVVGTDYATGVKLTPEEMEALEAEAIRPPALDEKWFVKIPRKRGRPRVMP